MMIRKSKPAVRIRRLVLASFFIFLALIISGCQAIGFYKQAIKGQYQILASQKPIEKLLTDPQTPATLKEKFRLVIDLREFARKDLKLPVDSYYVRYADLKRPY